MGIKFRTKAARDAYRRHLEAPPSILPGVYDQSEKPRATRAQWQGLSWLRFACRAAWELDEQPEYSRSGFEVTEFWRDRWTQCSDRIKKHVAYYTAFSHGDPVRIEACGCPRIGKLYPQAGIPQRSACVAQCTGGKL